MHPSSQCVGAALLWSQHTLKGKMHILDARDSFLSVSVFALLLQLVKVLGGSLALHANQVGVNIITKQYPIAFVTS